MRKLVITAAIAALSAGTASAADMAPRTYTKAPPPIVQVYNWTGFYIGGQVGGAWSDYHHEFSNLTGDVISHRADSVTGGGHIGYNYQFNQFVLGVEAEFNGTDLSGSSPSVNVPSVTFASKTDWYGTVVGRLGVAFDRALIYATGGVAFADIKISGVAPLAPDSFSSSDTRVGWTVGAGVAYQITDNWIAGVDYKHIEFESFDRSGITDIALLPYTVTGIDTKIDQVTARLSYKFGGPIVAKY